MARNNTVIAAAKEVAKLKKIIERDASEIYASMVLCLSDEKYGWPTEKIEELLCDISGLWNSSVEQDISMTDWCSRVTGIDVLEDIRCTD